MTLSPAGLEASLESLPRRQFMTSPTPLERLPRLSSRLGIELWIKRDDLTSLALGGNKTRKLEYLIAEAIAEEADVVVTTGSSQSNHARISAAACRRSGLDCYLVLEAGRHLSGGNFVLDRLMGVEVELVDGSRPEDRQERLLEVVAGLRDVGRRPKLVPPGGSSVTGALGYAAGFVELSHQMHDLSLEATALYVATSTCGTQAGLVAGATAAMSMLAIRGVSVNHPQSQQEDRVHTLATEVLSRLGLPGRATRESVSVDDTQVGEGYGCPTTEMWEALALLAQAEGIFLDPVYTGKAMSSLIADVRSGRIAQGETIIFLHTGGTPALFAYASELP